MYLILLQRSTVNVGHRGGHEMFRPSDETGQCTSTTTKDKLLVVMRSKQYMTGIPVETVCQWLHDAGVHRDSVTHSENKAWLAASVTAKQMESLLFTENHECEDLKTGCVQPACDRYHIPARIRQHIDYITPGIKLIAPSNIMREERRQSLQKRQRPNSDFQPLPPRRKPRSLGSLPHHKYNLSDCDVGIISACIAALYEIPPAFGKVHEGDSLGIDEAELNYWISSTCPH